MLIKQKSPSLPWNLALGIIKGWLKKMIKKVITNLYSSKASGPACIPVAVLKNPKLELSYILAELFNMCLKGLVFQIVGRSHWWSLYWRIFGRGLHLQTTSRLAFFLWLIKVCKKLVNNRIVDRLEKCDLFSTFQYGCRSSQSTSDILTSCFQLAFFGNFFW